MRIKLSPQRCGPLDVVKSGDALTINGETRDFSALPDGATLPIEAIGCDWINGDVTRAGGQLVVPLIFPVAAQPSGEQIDPADIVDPPDGPIALPQPDPEEA